MLSYYCLPVLLPNILNKKRVLKAAWTPSGAGRRPDAARVGQDSNPCMIVLIPSATTGLSVVTVGWLLELSLKNLLKSVA